MPSWRSLTKIVGSGSGCVSQRYGSADPDPYQNVTDPQHWVLFFILLCCKWGTINKSNLGTFRWALTCSNFQPSDMVETIWVNSSSWHCRTLKCEITTERRENQSCGSALINCGSGYGSGSSIFLIADPDPGLDDLKLKKIYNWKFNFYFLDQKLQFTYPRPP